MTKATAELIETGLSIVGNMPWGTHFCHFYETKADLLDILIPYFKAGVENNELCIWIVFDPLNEEEARQAFRQSVSGADQYLASGAIEIIPYTQWYLKNGGFNAQHAINGWQRKLAQALAKGYKGLRLNGNEAWLTEDDWDEFSEYERILNENVANQKTIVLCTYPIAGSGASEIFDVARTHQFAIARRRGNWEVIETPEVKQAKVEIKKLNEDLEQRVVERTKQLATANEELRSEIAERQQIEKALKDSQQQYEQLLQSLDGIIWESDAATLKFIFVSNQAERILGYPLEQWLNEPNFWITHLHEDDRDWAIDFCRDATARRVAHQFEYRMVAADGRVVWLRDHVTVHLLADNSVRLRGVMFDITEHKRGEDEFRRQKDILQKIFDNVPITISFYDKDGHLVLVNREYERTFGWTVQELDEQNIDVFVEAFPDPTARQRVLAFLGAATGEWTDFKVRAKDGRLIEVWGAVVRASDGTSIAIGQDITERKQADENLLKEKLLTEQVMNSMPGICYVLDEQPRFLRWNKNFERVTGYSSEDLSQISPLDLFEGKDREKIKECLEHVFTKGRSSAEVELVAKDGTLTPYWLSGRRTVLGDKVCDIGVGLDISEHKHLKEQLHQAQKMEAIGQLAGGIAHDFNNLLTVINGYSQITLRQLQKGDPLYHNLEEVYRAGERAASLTHQLLAFSRKQILQPKVLDLNAVISEMKNMLQRIIGEHIELQMLQEAALGSVKADPGQIEQVIMNLVINARDAMPNGGKLIVETKNVYLGADHAASHIAVNPGFYVMLAISDTGIGIDEQTQSHIFEPFFTTKEFGKGTGLGLSTVYGIVKQSEGNIWVYSEPGRGTTFKIYLPRIGEDAQEYKESNKPATPHLNGSETILLTEDDPLVRQITHEILEMYGYKVLEAANGGAAFLICEHHQGQIHLLLTDVVMPEMSGRELANRLTPLRPEMKVLYMSGYTDDLIVHHGILDPGTSFLEKPFSPEGLALKVRQVLDGS